jgi:hypothetical protein
MTRSKLQYSTRIKLHLLGFTLCYRYGLRAGSASPYIIALKDQHKPTYAHTHTALLQMVLTNDTRRSR